MANSVWEHPTLIESKNYQLLVEVLEQLAAIRLENHVILKELGHDGTAFGSLSMKGALAKGIEAPEPQPDLQKLIMAESRRRIALRSGE